LNDFLTKSAELDSAQQQAQDTAAARQAAINQKFAQAAAEAQAAAAANQAVIDAQATQDAQAIAEAQAAAAAAKQVLMETQAALLLLINQVIDFVKQEIKAQASGIKADVAAVKTSIYDKWRAKIKASYTGSGEAWYWIDPESAKGAKEAMNDKYGEGSVSW
jgi:hypothetical protein